MARVILVFMVACAVGVNGIRVRRGVNTGGYNPSRHIAGEYDRSSDSNESDNRGANFNLSDKDSDSENASVSRDAPAPIICFTDLGKSDSREYGYNKRVIPSRGSPEYRRAWRANQNRPSTADAADAASAPVVSTATSPASTSTPDNASTSSQNPSVNLTT